MRRGKKWIGAGVMAVIVAVVVVILAQGSGGGGDALNAIAKAAEVTQREPGGRATIKAKVTVSNSPEGLGFVESGTMDFENSGRAQGTFTVRGLSNGKEAEVESIADGTTSYTTSEAIESITEGKKWMKLDLAGAAKLQGGASPAEGGPQEGLKVIERVQNAEELGTETVDGVSATHYRGTFPATEEVFGVKAHFSAPRADVWIDSQDRVRRMQILVTGSIGESNQSSTTEMDFNFVEFGRVPKIELPPADEVFDATGEFEAGIQEAATGN